jgi:hypothetical protein
MHKHLLFICLDFWKRKLIALKTPHSFYNINSGEHVKGNGHLKLPISPFFPFSTPNLKYFTVLFKIVSDFRRKFFFNKLKDLYQFEALETKSKN